MRASPAGIGVGFGLVVALGAGCGGSGPSISTSADNVCSEVAEVACYDMYRCCSEGEIENYLNVSDPRTEAQCRDDVRKRCERQIGLLDWSIEEGRARFDAEVMNACLEALIAPDDACVTVEAMLPWAEVCMTSAWVGTVANGGACFYTYECASVDSYCGSNRTCIARPVDGQPCGTGCASGFYCAAGTCRPLLGAGGACTSSLQCAADLFCDFAATPVACAPIRADGQPCNGNAACQSGQCLPGTCVGSTQTCFTDASCIGRCADDNSACFDAGDCGAGMCSIGGAVCFDPLNCTGAGNMCVFPVACNPGDCVGDIVCAPTTIVVDYCTAVGALPP